MEPRRLSHECAHTRRSLSQPRAPGRTRLSAPRRRADGTGDGHRPRLRCVRRRAAGRDRHRHEPEHHVGYHGTTNEAGNYVITSVPIGEYVISAALPGFKGVQAKVTLQVAQTARVDFRMEVGNVEETVDVIATGAILQTENAVVGTKADREQIEKLPAVGRNVSSVTLFVAWRHAAGHVVVQQHERGRSALRQRAAAAGQQLHHRRRRQQRGDQQRHRLPAEPGRGRTGERRDQQLLGRARQRDRRPRQHGDQVGHQRDPRERLLLLARQQPGGDAVGHQPCRRRRNRSYRATSSGAHSAARCCATSCSSSPTIRADVRRRRRATRSPPSSRTPGGRAT